jgi:hypothetical protein
LNLIALFGVIAVLALSVVWILRKVLLPAAVTDCTPEWLDEFSVEKYRPMLRLLEQTDYDFLAGQAGQSPKTIRRFRTERRRIFRAYLRSLSADFQRLHLAGRMLLVYSPEDRSDLAAKLFQQRCTFMLAMVRVQFGLMLHTVGIGTVDVRNILGIVEGLRIEIASAEPGVA